MNAGINRILTSLLREYRRNGSTVSVDRLFHTYGEDATFNVIVNCSRKIRRAAKELNVGVREMDEDHITSQLMKISDYVNVMKSLYGVSE